MAVTTFLDTSVLLAGLIDFGPQSAPAQSVMHAVAEKTIAGPGTAWHCCLELYSVCTRLPPEFRLSAADASRLIEEEVLARLTIHDLPGADKRSFFRAAAADGTIGGRVYDAHIAEVARAAVEGMHKERPVVIPGAANRVGAALAHLAPKRLLAPLVARNHPGLRRGR